MITRELRLTAEVWTKDASALADLCDEIGNCPKGYTLARIDTDTPVPNLRNEAQGTLIVAVTAVLRGQDSVANLNIRISADSRDAEAKLRSLSNTLGGMSPKNDVLMDAARNLRSIADRLIDLRGYAGRPNLVVPPLFMSTGPDSVAEVTPGMANTIAAKAARDFEGGMPRHDTREDVVSWAKATDPPLMSYQATDGTRYSSKVAHDADRERREAEERRVKSLEFQIQTIREYIERQDKFARPAGGVRHFDDRMAFSDHLARMADTIRLMMPEPGGREIGRYRDLLQGIAANCIRELAVSAERDHGLTRRAGP